MFLEPFLIPQIGLDMPIDSLNFLTTFSVWIQLSSCQLIMQAVWPRKVLQTLLLNLAVQANHQCSILGRCSEQVRIFRPLNSHDFTVCHTFSLFFSRSDGRFFISHRFTNFKIFPQTHNFLRKQTWQHNSLSKKYLSIVLYIQKINKSVMFDSETSTRSFPGNSCPLNYQKIYEKHPSSINLIKSVLFRDSFCNNLETS